MKSYGGKFWDKRYSSTEFVYGREPNIFFKEELLKLTPGKLLMIGEGEGRNAVFAAKHGWEVDAVDFSTIAKEKAMKLAEKNKVSIRYDVCELTQYNFRQNHYDAVANIFLHLDITSRQIIYPESIVSLKKKGVLLLEVFHKEQLGRNTGGPQNSEMLYSEEELNEYFKSMQIQFLEKKIINLEEGDHHKGEVAVIRLIALRK